MLPPPPYDEGKTEFIDELHMILGSWQGPLLIGGDFNLCRFRTDKSNGNINQRYEDCFNDWVNKWGLIEISPSNRKFTWSNNQSNLIQAKLDRVFMSTDWEATFPLVRVLGLPKSISDHVPLLVDIGEGCFRMKKKIRFEKWWMEREDFKEVVNRAWNVSTGDKNAMDVWQLKI
jgi:exonuclease III